MTVRCVGCLFRSFGSDDPDKSSSSVFAVIPVTPAFCPTPRIHFAINLIWQGKNCTKGGSQNPLFLTIGNRRTMKCLKADSSNYDA